MTDKKRSSPPTRSATVDISRFSAPEAASTAYKTPVLRYEHAFSSSWTGSALCDSPGASPLASTSTHALRTPTMYTSRTPVKRKSSTTESAAANRHANSVHPFEEVTVSPNRKRNAVNSAAHQEHNLNDCFHAALVSAKLLAGRQRGFHGACHSCLHIVTCLSQCARAVLEDELDTPRRRPESTTTSSTWPISPTGTVCILIIIWLFISNAWTWAFRSETDAAESTRSITQTRLPQPRLSLPREHWWTAADRDAHSSSSTLKEQHIRAQKLRQARNATYEAISGYHSSTIDDGSPARIAMVIAADTDLYEWMILACSFADEDYYGHSITVFFEHEPEDMAGMCDSQIELRKLSGEVLEGNKPNICLAPVEFADALPPSCVHIALDDEDVVHLDWLATLSKESLLEWHTPQIELVVVTNNRPRSLYRLLKSLRDAQYLSDSVNLFVNLEQTADQATRSLVTDAHWPYGSVQVRHRIVLGGLMTSVIESWYPANNDTYGVILEDDVEVSPLFYSWLKYTILRYRYGQAKAGSSRMFGVSLYQHKVAELHADGRHAFDASSILAEADIPATSPYLSQVPCSWGAVYFPEIWREFHDFVSHRLAEEHLDLAEIIVPDSRSNRWLRSWKRYFIELIYLRGYAQLYPNYEDYRSLSTNHLEVGTHVIDEAMAAKRRELFEVPLISQESSLTEGLPDFRLPRWDSLPVFDLWGSLTSQAELVERGQAAVEQLSPCRAASSHTKQQPSYHATDLFCPRTWPVDVDQHHLLAQNRSLTVEEQELLLLIKQHDLDAFISTTAKKADVE